MSNKLSFRNYIQVNLITVFVFWCLWENFWYNKKKILITSWPPSMVIQASNEICSNILLYDLLSVDEIHAHAKFINSAHWCIYIHQSSPSSIYNNRYCAACIQHNPAIRTRLSVHPLRGEVSLSQNVHLFFRHNNYNNYNTYLKLKLSLIRLNDAIIIKTEFDLHLVHVS